MTPIDASANPMRQQREIRRDDGDVMIGIKNRCAPFPAFMQKEERKAPPREGDKI
jgi:hypothetical protein